MDGIKPGYRSKEPSEIFNTRPQPGPGLSAGAMGPKKQPEALGVESMMEPEEKSLSRDDLLLAVRKMRGYFDSKLLESEQKHQKLYGEASTLIKAMTEEIKKLRVELSTHTKSLQDSQSGQSKLENEHKSLKEYVEKGFPSLEKKWMETAVKQFEDQDKWLSKRLESLDIKNISELARADKAFQTGMEVAESKFLSWMKMLPQTQVTNVFPEGAIKMADVQVNVPQQAAPVINNNLESVKLMVSDKTFDVNVNQPAQHIHVPLGAISVKAEPAIVTVNVPPQAEQKAPEVHLNVPEPKTPEINLITPKIKKTIKHINYNPDGSPGQIEEEHIYEKDS